MRAAEAEAEAAAASASLDPSSAERKGASAAAVAPAPAEAPPSTPPRAAAAAAAAIASPGSATRGVGAVLAGGALAEAEAEGGVHGPPKAFLTPYEDAALRLGPHGSAIDKFNFSFESVWIVAAWATMGWFRRKEWHVTGFLLGLAWFLLQCLYLTYWLEKAACTIGITPGAMGTVLGAAGTSIPNLLCSLVVARQGRVVMATGEVWGSNIWLVFACMGLPWGIYSSATGKAVRVQNSTSLTVWIAACLGLFLAQSLYTKWHYTRVHAWGYILLYVAFVVFVFCNESLHFVDSTS